MENLETLQECRRRHKLVIACRAKLAAVRLSSAHTYSGVSGGERGGICAQIEREERAADKLCAAEKALREAQAEAWEIIRQLPDKRHRLVLEGRYIRGMSWESVAGWTKYSQRHIRRLHYDALNLL